MLVSSFVFPEVATISQGGTFFGCLQNPNLLLSEPKLCNKHKGESSQPKNSFPVIAGNGSW
jgi:hypothetical protein